MRRKTKQLKKRKNQKPVATVLVYMVIICGVFIIPFLVTYHYISEKNKEYLQRYELLKPHLYKAVIKTTYPIPQSLQVPIITYHYVEDVKDSKDTTRIKLNVPPRVFEEQLKLLVTQKYTFITPSELADIMDGKRPLPSKPIILSFDDGYEDFYTDAFPLLKKYNIKSVQYIVPGFIGQPNYMSEKQIKEISQSQLVEIGAHTLNHIWLKGESYQKADEQITQSKILLEEMFGIPVVSFAYPYGAFDDQAVEIVKKAGFRTAVSTITGVHEDAKNRYFIYRLRPGVISEKM